MGRLKATLASHNRNKLRELAAALPGWEVELVEAELPPELGSTYYENARAKAEFVRGLVPSTSWVLGEDSGIEVMGLGGRPGVETARWAAGEPVERMLEALAGRQGDARDARYVSELVAISPDGREVRGTGTLDGRIALEAGGSEGFGFDPVFIPAEEERTVAELGDEWKRLNSHRARAATALLAAMPKFAAPPGPERH